MIEIAMKMNYCINCGHPLTLSQIDHDPVERHYCENCGQVHYSNPKMLVGCVAYWGEKVLLCKRAIEPFVGYWNVPAGYLENGETAEEGAERETWEEARAKVQIESIHTVYSLTHINQIYLHFMAALDDPDVKAGEESLEADLFRESEIPWDDLAFSSTYFTLQKFFEDRRKAEHKPHIGAFTKYRKY